MSLKHQTVQRTYAKSDKRYGSVHRIPSGSVTTECGLDINKGHWWILGYENQHPATCIACCKARTPKQPGDAYQRAISKRYAEIRSQ